MHDIDLIVVAREFGAGGSELAAALGARLGWPVLDRDIIARVAERLRVDRDDVEARDEHAPGILERIGSAVLRTSPEYSGVSVGVNLPDPDDIAAATQDVLKDAAASPPLVVVGHGAQALFHDRPRTLRLRLNAPLADRARRVCRRVGCTGEDAVGLAKRMDAERVGYVRRYYHREWNDPHLYHLQIDTSFLDIAEAVELVLAVVGRAR